MAWLNSRVFDSSTDVSLPFPTPPEFFRALADPNHEMFVRYPFVPLDAPGMPPIGPDVVRHVESVIFESVGIDTWNDYSTATKKTVADNWIAYTIFRALYDPTFRLNILVKGRPVYTGLQPGHLWDYRVTGPIRSALDYPQVMVIGKHPGIEEERFGRNFIGSTSDLFQDVLERVGFDSAWINEWYVTNIARHRALDPASSTIQAAWIKNCAVLLAQELRIVRPDFIFCLGGEACKHVLGSQYKVSSMSGRVVPLEIPLHTSASEEPRFHTAQVLVSIHPAAVAYKPEMENQLLLACGNFRHLIAGDTVGETADEVCHLVVDTEEDLREVVNAVLEEPDNDLIAVDCEWQGDRPTDDNAYLRTIQFSHRPKFACCVVLHRQGGVPAIPVDAAVKELSRLLISTPERKVRIGGHFLRSDLPWLIHAGLDLREQYAPPRELPRRPPAWQRTKLEGGFDTGLMFHAIEETQELKLETLAMRYTSAPRYDIQKDEEVTAYCSANKISSKYLDGFGFLTDDVLHAYGNYDADVTRRLAGIANGEGDADGMLDRDALGNSCREAYYQSHRASLGFLEMEQNGFRIDRERTELLTEDFVAARNELIARLREAIQWPTFNPNSVLQVRELLFGEHLNGTIDKTTGEHKRLRPRHARCFWQTPIKTCGKPARDWQKVVDAGEMDRYSPSTDKEVLGILGRTTPEIWMLRNYRFAQKMLDTVLRPPDQALSARADEWDEDEEDAVYSKGIISFIKNDGRVHSRFRQTTETGRSASSNPNAQTWTKRREKDYKEILGSRYRYPVRSIVCAAPGHLFVEADLKSAELAMIGWLSQCPNMIEDVRRNCLDEDHPDYFDIHSDTAVRAFQLDTKGMKVTKSLLEDVLKCGQLRVGAKNVNFGIPYGRSDEAIARQCREEGANVSIMQAGLLREAYFNRYPEIGVFLDDCAARSQHERFLCGVNGRSRRFVASMDKKVKAAQEREAQNFLIQNGVAEKVDVAIDELYRYRETHSVEYRILLQIHDAVLLEVPYEHVAKVVTEVLPTCMVDRVPIWPTHLDGSPMEHIEQPYRFGIDVEVFQHWGVKLKADQLQEQFDILLPKKAG